MAEGGSGAGGQSPLWDPNATSRCFQDVAEAPQDSGAAEHVELGLTSGEGGRGERPRASALLLTKGPVTTRTYNPEIDPAKISVIKELMWTQDRTHSTARVVPLNEVDGEPMMQDAPPGGYWFPLAQACRVSIEGVKGDDRAHRELRRREMLALVKRGVVGPRTVTCLGTALLAYTVLLVLKYVVLPIDTPSQFITAWAIQVLPVAFLGPVLFPVVAGHVLLLGAFCPRSWRCTRYLRILILPFLLGWVLQLQFQVASLSTRIWIPFNGSYTLVLAVVAMLLQWLITCDFRWCGRQARGLLVITTCLVQVQLACLCFAFTFFGGTSLQRMSYFLLFRVYGILAQLFCKWACSYVVFLDDFGLTASTTVEVWCLFFAATALPTGHHGFGAPGIVIYLAEAFFHGLQSYVKIRVLTHPPLRLWVSHHLCSLFQPELDEWTVFHTGAMAYLDLQARLICTMVMVPLFWWFRFGHSAHFYPFNSLNAESLVLKTTFLLGTALAHVLIFVFLRRRLFLRKGLMDPLLSGTAYLRMHMVLFLCVGAGILLPFICLPWQTQILPVVFSMSDPSLLPLYACYNASVDISHGAPF